MTDPRDRLAALLKAYAGDTDAPGTYDIFQHQADYLLSHGVSLASPRGSGPVTLEEAVEAAREALGASGPVHINRRGSGAGEVTPNLLDELRENGKRFIDRVLEAEGYDSHEYAAARAAWLASTNPLFTDLEWHTLAPSGSSAEPVSPRPEEKCPECGGSGTTPEDHGEGRVEMLSCPECRGTGKSPAPTALPVQPQPDAGMTPEFWKGMQPGWVQEYQRHQAAHPFPPGNGRTWEEAYRTLAAAVNSMPETCDDSCDSHGHSEACGAKSAAWPAEEIVRLRSALGIQPSLQPSPEAIAAAIAARFVNPDHLAAVLNNQGEGARDTLIENTRRWLTAAYAAQFAVPGGPLKEPSV